MNNWYRVRIVVFLTAFLIIILVANIGHQYDIEKLDATSTVLKIANLENGDAKFYNNKIITTIDGALTIINFDGKILKRFKEVSACWIDIVDEDGVVVYGNLNKEIGIVRLDKENNIISNNIVIRNKNLNIDQTIIKDDNMYYITSTEIKGAVNNSDPNVECGEYIIHLYKSDNLKDWKHVGEVARAKNNLEDIDVFVRDGWMYAMYEKEVLDKGNSSICIKMSSDMGESWGEAIELLQADCDHEPAAIVYTDDTYTIYYSCDKDALGTSYAKSKAYYSVYDYRFNIMKKDVLIETDSKIGVILYDISVIDGKRYALFTKDYFSNHDMVVEKER